MPERKDAGGPPLGEVEIIARYFAPLAEGVREAMGLADDAALVPSEAGKDFVVTTDGLVAGRHFTADAKASDIAFKALAVNVSDLIAKGADPYLYFLTLALPAPDPRWLEAFAGGLAEAQGTFGCRLAGGDTVGTPGPLTLSITALGKVAAGAMVTRSGGHEGDLVYVSGTIGDAALGLELIGRPAAAGAWQLTADEAAHLKARYRRPAPRRALASVLSRHAHAAMDVSDGLFGDFETLCRASATGGEIEAARIPLSPAAAQALKRDPACLPAIANGGDDYEVLAAIAAPEARAFEEAAEEAGVRVTRIGVLKAPGEGVHLRNEIGQGIALGRAKFDHFAGSPGPGEGCE